LEAVLPAYDGLLTSTVHVLTAVARARTGRVVLAGSLVEPQVLTDSATPGSPYAAAKWAGSVYGRMFHALYHVPVVCTRLGYTYGPGQPPTRVVAYVVASLLRGESPRLTDGDACFDWVFVDDVVAGLMAAGSAPHAVGRSIDLGSGRLTSVREVVGHLVRLVGAGVEPSLGSLPNRPAEGFRAADLATTQDVLGWCPETPLLEGLQRTVAWHRAQARGGSKCEC
jgi:nucleoside-diphosphate-sugar epimerase